MALKPLKRTYGLADANMITMCQNVHGAGTRDVAELTAYGMDETWLQDFETAIEDFIQFPKDEFYSAQISIATQDKNEKLAEVTNLCESVVRRAINKWGKGTPHVRQFGFEGFGRLDDANKIQTAWLVHHAGTANLDALETEGLTLAILDSLKTAIDALKDARVAKETAVKTRDAKVQERIGMGNKLYADLVKLADTGKEIWEDTDESKYNDYVLYSAGSDPVQVVEATVAAGAVVEPSVVVDSASDSIEINNSGPAAIVVYFDDDPGALPSETAIEVAAGATQVFTAGSNGWLADNNRLLLHNPDEVADAGVEVRVS